MHRHYTPTIAISASSASSIISARSQHQGPLGFHRQHAGAGFAHHRDGVPPYHRHVEEQVLAAARRLCSTVAFVVLRAMHAPEHNGPEHKPGKHKKTGVACLRQNAG